LHWAFFLTFCTWTFRHSFIFMNIAGGTFILNISFDAWAPCATCCPHFSQFASLGWLICHAFFASVWTSVKSSRAAQRRLLLAKATLEPSVMSSKFAHRFPAVAQCPLSGAAVLPEAPFVRRARVLASLF
jgi:hypothetical protein